MRLIVVAPLWLQIPADGYGGIERHVYNVVNGLVDRGHHVTLFAPGTTRSRAHELVAISEKPLRETGVDWSDLNYNLTATSRALRRAVTDGADAVLFSVERPYYLSLTALSQVPCAFTLHGVWTPETQPQTEVDMLLAHRDQHFISISRAQQRAMPELAYLDNVYNGLDIATHTFSPTADRHAVWMGRFEEEKGAHLAIAVAQKVGIPLLLAGPRRPELPAAQAYWEEHIAPHLGHGVEYVGEVYHEAKVQLLGEAAVMINPYVYLEAFGYATLESLACGTPVVVPAWGAGSEIIEEGVSGFSGGTVDEWAVATERALSLDRRACRARAERFDTVHMVEGYERALSRLAGLELTGQARARHGSGATPPAAPLVTTAP